LVIVILMNILIVLSRLVTLTGRPILVLPPLFEVTLALRKKLMMILLIQVQNMSNLIADTGTGFDDPIDNNVSRGQPHLLLQKRHTHVKISMQVCHLHMMLCHIEATGRDMMSPRQCQEEPCQCLMDQPPLTLPGERPSFKTFIQSIAN
jgi:hypothetical protein